MKNALQNLLVFLSLCLCGLIAWQWHAQVLQRQETTGLNQTIYDQGVAIQGYTNSINALDKQIAQMDARLTEFRETVRSNDLIIVTLRQENAGSSNALAQYKAAVETMQAQVKQANESILKQNQAIKDVVAQRDEFVKQLNDSVKERNDLVAQYNELAKRYQELVASVTNKVSQPKK